MDMVVFLSAGAVLHIGWGVLHLFFPRIFKWSEELQKMDAINRRIYPVLNVCLTFYFFAVAYLSLVYGEEMLASPLGKQLIGIFAAFWLLRLGLQFKFFNNLHPVSLVFSLFFGLTFLAYALPLLR